MTMGQLNNLLAELEDDDTVGDVVMGFDGSLYFWITHEERDPDNPTDFDEWMGWIEAVE